ncbi:hypothetical protein DY000_02049181 [Brassica cretica]|uniref:Retrotransposon gag domain-containing protein n=1 Tax=Brassica cretica TaxID=69181 RepID=A0ABQ7ESS9_BRACR|nr:hypothetical protein DY000_02049181 [Brassica cretica]
MVHKNAGKRQGFEATHSQSHYINHGHTQPETNKQHRYIKREHSPNKSWKALGSTVEIKVPVGEKYSSIEFLQTPGRTLAFGSPLRGTPVPRYGVLRDELPEATQREAELQRQIDDLQGQVTGLHRTREETNPELSLEFQTLKEKLNEHSKQLEQSTEKLSQLESENLTLRDENQALNTASNKKRRFRTQIPPMPTLETPNSETGSNLPTTAPGGDASTREKAKDAQTYDVEDNESEPEPDKGAPDGIARAESSMIAHLHQMFSERLDAMQSMVERLPGVAPPIWKSNLDSYADTPFTDEITLIEMPMKFSFPSIKAYDGTTDPDDHVAQYKQRMLAVELPKGSYEAATCKGFGSSLTGPALQWYINLPSGSIASFAVLSDKFVEQFASSRDLEKTSDSLYEILQHRAEPMRGYIARFNQEKVAIPECSIPTADVPQSEDQSRESDQYEDQNVRNNSIEVQSSDRAEQTDRAVYRIDPRTQARIEFDRVETETDRGFSLLSRLDRTGDRSDELIRHFDQFMNFELTNLSKARLLKLSDDLASIWSRTVRENLPSEHEDRTEPVLLLTAGRAVGYIESGHGLPNDQNTSSNCTKVHESFYYNHSFAHPLNPTRSADHLFEISKSQLPFSTFDDSDVPQSEDQSMESDQYEDQNVRNNSIEVQSSDRAEQTDRAEYRIDPRTSGLELQHNPRPDDRINHTEARLSRPVRYSKTIGQARTEFDRVEPETDHGFSLLSCLDRTGDHSDELIRHFDQFMNFELTNLSKARLLKLSDDLASIWSRTARENLQSEHEDRTGRILLLTAGRVGYIESGHG